MCRNTTVINTIDLRTDIIAAYNNTMCNSKGGHFG